MVQSDDLNSPLLPHLYLAGTIFGHEKRKLFMGMNLGSFDSAGFGDFDSNIERQSPIEKTEMSKTPQDWLDLYQKRIDKLPKQAIPKTLNNEALRTLSLLQRQHQFLTDFKIFKFNGRFFKFFFLIFFKFPCFQIFFLFSKF